MKRKHAKEIAEYVFEKVLSGKIPSEEKGELIDAMQKEIHWKAVEIEQKERERYL